MKIKEVIKKIKHYPIVIGLFCVFLVMMLVLAIKLYDKSSTVDATIVTEDLSRPATSEGFQTGEDIIKYMISAIKENDLDKALRGFPIDERILGINSEKIINQEAAFSKSSNYPPSSTYGQYIPLASSEMTGNYAEMFEEVKNSVEWSQTEILDIRILRPKEQFTNEYKKTMSEQCENWGAEVMCEMVVELKNSDGVYILPVTIIRYYDSWKVFDFRASLFDNKTEIMWEINEDEFEDLTDPVSEEEVWRSFEEDSEDTQEQKASESPETQLLPPNYFVVNQQYGDTPEDTIEKFSMYLEKEDTTAVLCYGYMEQENPDANLSDVLMKQQDFAEQVVSFYYGLLCEELSGEEKSLDELGMTGNEIVGELNPENIPYMDLVKIVSLNENEYLAVYFYGREYYVAGFTLHYTDQGWQIESISSAKGGLNPGEVKRISEEEYNKLGEE